jgi:hypothetical protein
MNTKGEMIKGKHSESLGQQSRHVGAKSGPSCDFLESL